MDAMEIWSTAWALTLLLEANKFWFYSLLFSLASCVLQLYRLRFLSAPSFSSGGSAKSKAKTNTLSRPLAKQILTDACDLLIPGSITGWARTSPAIVGLATVVSTLLASEEIWYRVQRPAAAASVKAIGKENQVKRKGKV
jgi:Peroxisomal biogenesis factor 11 (PEX11)